MPQDNLHQIHDLSLFGHGSYTAHQIVYLGPQETKFKNVTLHTYTQNMYIPHIYTFLTHISISVSIYIISSLIY